MNKTLIVFATLMEAQGSIEALSAKSTSNPSLFHFAQGSILICGMGTACAAAAVALHGQNHDEIWNYGIAGALHDHLSIGTLYPISSIAKHLSLLDHTTSHVQRVADSAHPLLNLDHAHPGYRLVTSDYPVYDASLRHTLGKQADLIDMEGYGIAMAAKWLGIPCFLYKMVSDFALEDGHLLIREKLARHSQEIGVLIKIKQTN